MAKQFKQPKQLRPGDRKWFHVVEFSKGKPNEISFNVLDKLSSDSKASKGFGKGRFFNKGSAETLTPEDFAAIHAESGTGPTNSMNSASTTGSFSAQTASQNAHQSYRDAKRAEKAQKRLEKRLQKQPEHRAKHHTTNFEAAPSRTMTIDSKKEVVNRKHRRRKYAIVSAFIIVAVCIGLLGVGGNYLYQKHIENMSNIELLTEGLNEIQKADETLVSIDNFLSESYSDDTVSNAQALITKTDTAKTNLATAKTYATRAEEGLESTSDDKQAAQYALKTIASRETLFDVSVSLLEQDIKAKNAMDSLSEAQDKIKQAEEFLTKSANVISNTNEDTVGKSTTYTNQAKSLFEEARALCVEAFDNYDSSDSGYVTTSSTSTTDSSNSASSSTNKTNESSSSAASETTSTKVSASTALANYTDYLDKRIESCDAALASNAAILLQDRQTAEGYNEQYNTADTEASELAKVFEKSFYQPLFDLYDAVTAKNKEQYQSLRSDVATNDAHLRSYLGTETKNQ